VALLAISTGIPSTTGYLRPHPLHVTAASENASAPKHTGHTTSCAHWLKSAGFIASDVFFIPIAQ
jgi:hypothetical protein